MDVHFGSRIVRDSYGKMNFIAFSMAVFKHLHGLLYYDKCVENVNGASEYFTGPLKLRVDFVLPCYYTQNRIVLLSEVILRL